MALPAANLHRKIGEIEKEHFRANGLADDMGPVNRVKARLDVNQARNQPHPGQNNLNNEDERNGTNYDSRLYLNTETSKEKNMTIFKRSCFKVEEKNTVLTY